MAKKSEKVVLEDIELKPQVIGHIYQKKSNIGRVLLIFVAFIAVIYYINDISVFVNDLFGKKSASSIKDIASDDKKKSIIKDKEDEEFYELNDNLVLVINDLTITHFNYNSNILSFDIYNYSEKDVDLSNKNYYLETYDVEQKVVDSKKVNVGLISQKNVRKVELELSNSFKYIRIIEK